MKNGFDERFIEQLKSKSDIVSVISRYTTVTQKGKNYWACCPFHNERTPSFCINPYEQFFHCFGCKEHGDVINFVEKMESCDFFTAVEILAKQANMEIPENNMDKDIKIRKKQKQTILNVLDEAYKHYNQNLFDKGSVVAQTYVKERRLTKKALDVFCLGYSKDWQEMVNHLISKGFSYEDIKLAGLALSKDERYYDVFGERLMFPIFNIHDECIAFSARSLTPTNYAKYKNSTNSVVFDKSKNMYGINNIRKLKQQNLLDNIIIVEGQMDVISMFTAGFENCVACLGTALTPYHAKQLKYISDNVILCLDGDSAGQNASMKAIDVLLESEINLKVVKIPDKMDPDEYIKTFGREKFKELLDTAKDCIEFQIEYVMQDFDLSQNSEKAKFIKKAIPVVDKLKTNSEKQVYLEMISKLSSVPVDVLNKDLGTKKDKEAEVEKQTAVYIEDAEIKAVKFVVASVLYRKDWVNLNDDLEKFIKNPDLVKIIETVKNNKDTFKISMIYDIFDVENSPNIVDIIEYNFEGIDNKQQFYKQCVTKIKQQLIKDRLAVLMQEYKNALSQESRKEILNNINELQKKLRINNLED